jgi:hypothetical protein
MLMLQLPDDPQVLSYVAGLVDGAGTVTIKETFIKGQSVNASHSPHVMVSSPHEETIAWLTSFGGTQDSLLPNAKRPNMRPSYRWHLHGRNAEDFLEVLYGYLKVKRDQADIVLEFKKIRGQGAVRYGTLSETQVTQRRALKDRINALNRKGLGQKEVE